MNVDKAISIASWAGAALIILDWVDVVPNAVGWFGFVVMVVCFVTQLVRNRRRSQ